MFAYLLDQIRRRRLIPTMSATERAALEAGDTWIETAFFSGRPDLREILAEPWPELTADERAFLDGPVAEVCRLTDPDEVEQSRGLSPAVWTHLRDHRFFGLAIPTEWGGHGFSSYALSTIFATLATRSLALSTVVLIPNSVGPAELLLEVGTDEQKRHFLPRLARGEEIPCFALTEPSAGSDASSLSSRGVVFRADDGTLSIRLDWDKRYITLAPIATLIGLAFQLEDPDNLLGHGEDIGITCALVDASLPGVEIGRRHDPMGLPFPNGPTRGHNVVIPVSRIIGGPAYAGHGWQMLMEALSGGRAISLPAQATAGGWWTSRVAGAYAAVREQFGLPIGRFEGIEEPLARIAGLTYLMDAARTFTCGAVDAGHRPAVTSAVMKYNLTELARDIATDAMDVMGGAALVKGPRNLMADGWVGSAIGITVEGANILTRTLIVFGQGTMRCHPHAHALLEAMRDGDTAAFRRLVGRQTGRLARNLIRLVRLELSRGWLTASGGVRGPLGRHARRLSWASARFAVLTDLVLATIGGALKTRGKLSGRFADLLSWMLLTTAVLRRYKAEGERPEDLPLARWAADYGLQQLQEAFLGLMANLRSPLIGPLVRGPWRAWCRLVPLGQPPSDRLGHQVARILLRPGGQRDRLSPGVYLPTEPDHPLVVLEHAFSLAAAAEPARTAIRRAKSRGKLGRDASLTDAVTAGVIDDEESRIIEQAANARAAAIQVDDFDPEAYHRRTGFTDPVDAESSFARNQSPASSVE